MATTSGTLNVLILILLCVFQLTEACWYVDGTYYCVYSLWYFWFGIFWLIVFLAGGCGAYFRKRHLMRQRIQTTTVVQPVQTHTQTHVISTAYAGGTTVYNQQMPMQQPVQAPPYGTPNVAPPPYQQSYQQPYQQPVDTKMYPPPGGAYPGAIDPAYPPPAGGGTYPGAGTSYPPPPPPQMSTGPGTTQQPMYPPPQM